MLILLSPTKTQHHTLATFKGKATKPLMLKEANQLNTILKTYSKQRLAQLMGVSDKIAKEVHAYVQHFESGEKNPAIFTYKGPAFQKLNVADFTAANLAYVQKHLLILTGMYGYLRPLDVMSNYRLEMGSDLQVNVDGNLYEFWRDKITKGINQIIKKEKEDIIINLASKEYFHAVDSKSISAKVISVVFKEKKDGKYKTIGIYAKQARGLMTRYIIKNRIEDLKNLERFKEANYRYNPSMSFEDEMVFVRTEVRA